MNIPELEVHGLATVTSIDDCPEIADGEGSVVTGRFVTREVNTIVRATILGPDGTTETIEGTRIHPIWSVDHNDWVPLGDLSEGESLQAADGIATVDSIAIVTTALPVYNIEVDGEHVYQVGRFSVLVHNTYLTPDQQALRQLIREATLRGRKPLTHSEAKAALELAQQVGLKTRASIRDVTGAHWFGPHIHINGVGISHIPVLPGFKP